MSPKLKAPLLIGVLAILMLGLYSVISHWMQAKKQVEDTVGSSDAKVKYVIRGAGDDYQGYFFLDSPVMQAEIARRALGINFHNDKGDYAERLEKFSKGEYDFIVLPIGSYLQHGKKYNYPGVIVSSIADSRGADAILGFSDKLKTGTVKDLNDASLKIVYTGESPSSFLLDLAIVDFDLGNLTRTDEWRKEVASSEAAFELAKKREGDVFVMWEPQVSRALREVPGLKVLFGSDRFSGYITDVVVFRRDFLKNREDDAVAFLESYFTTMRLYKGGDRKKLISDMKAKTGLQDTEVEEVLKKIDYHDLQTNCMRQFGMKLGTVGDTNYGVLNSIIACSNILVKTKKLDAALDDPYRIINTNILRKVQQNLPADLGNGAGKREFKALSASEWKVLTEIGTLRVEPIGFEQGSADLNEAGLAAVDAIFDLLANNYPDTRVCINGHTGKGENEDANVALSLARSKAVMDRLVQKGLSVNRFQPVGKGSAVPPKDSTTGQPITNPRQLMYKAPRVEFTLYMDVSGF
jgi:outer membrane protein OmpA-like peptidoglycan-associated protein